MLSFTNSSTQRVPRTGTALTCSHLGYFVGQSLALAAVWVRYKQYPNAFVSDPLADKLAFHVKNTR